MLAVVIATRKASSGLASSWPGEDNGSSDTSHADTSSYNAGTKAGIYIRILKFTGDVMSDERKRFERDGEPLRYGRKPEYTTKDTIEGKIDKGAKPASGSGNPPLPKGGSSTGRPKDQRK